MRVCIERMNALENKIYTATVSQLNKYIKQMMDGAPILNNIWVKGEISNYKRHFSGHMYLTLKDDGGVLRAVMFKSAAIGLRFEPENGMKVLARGKVGVYERDGAYQLYIEEMTVDGVGELYIAYEKLKKQLEEEGLFDHSHKKPLPCYPRTVGVVTARTGAAVRDIINVLKRRYPICKVLLYPSLVQGEGAAENICRGIEYFNETGSADVLIVGRGGGSIEDLWAFNEEITARAIYNSKIPVISAVGHETDFTIADFAADLRAPTPSAAAELAVPSVMELRQQFNRYNQRIIRAQQNVIDMKRGSLEKIKLKDVKTLLNDFRLRFDSFGKILEKDMLYNIGRQKDKIAKLSGKLDAMSPLAVLSRGYSITMKDDTKSVVKRASDVCKGDKVSVMLGDGQIKCEVI